MRASLAGQSAPCVIAIIYDESFSSSRIPQNKSARSQQWETRNRPSDLNEACPAAKSSLIRQPRQAMKYKQMLKIRKIEKDPQVRDRILLNVLVKRDVMSVTGAALHLGMALSWGVKWHNRYLKEGIAGLQTRTRSGHPPRISSETLKAVKKKKKDSLPDGRRPARYHSRRFRHRVHDEVYDIVRALPAAQLGVHQESSDGTAREESKQAEDRVVPQEAGAAGRGEDGISRDSTDPRPSAPTADWSSRSGARRTRRTTGR